MRDNSVNSGGYEVRAEEEEIQGVEMSSDDSGSVRLMLAYLCVATEKEASLERKVEILDRFGLTDAEIAGVCKSAVQSIRNARHHASKSKKKK
jgi:hypothetical protein